MQLASAAVLVLAAAATVLGVLAAPALAVPVGDDAPAGNDGPVEGDGERDLADMARDGAHKMADMAHEGLNKMVELAKSAGHKMADMAHAVKEELAGGERGAPEASGDEAKAGQEADAKDGHVTALIGCADTDGGCGGGDEASRMRRSAQHESEGERRRREVNRVTRALLEGRQHQVARLAAEQEAHRRHLTDPTDNSHDHDLDGQHEHGGPHAPDAHDHQDHLHDAMDDVHGEGHLHGHQGDADHHDDHDHEDALSSQHEQNEHDVHDGHSEHEHDHLEAEVADAGDN